MESSFGMKIIGHEKWFDVAVKNRFVMDIEKDRLLSIFKLAVCNCGRFQLNHEFCDSADTEWFFTDIIVLHTSDIFFVVTQRSGFFLFTC